MYKLPESFVFYKWQSNILCISSLCFIINGIISNYHRQYILCCVQTLCGLASINYWRNPIITSYRRNIDLIVAVNGWIYTCYAGLWLSGVKGGLSWGLMTSGFVSFTQSWIIATNNNTNC